MAGIAGSGIGLESLGFICCCPWAWFVTGIVNIKRNKTASQAKRMTPDMARLLNRATGRCDELLLAESPIAESLINACAKGISNQTSLQAFCNLSRIRISFMSTSQMVWGTSVAYFSDHRMPMGILMA
jgi:hypothetical protein